MLNGVSSGSYINPVYGNTQTNQTNNVSGTQNNTYGGDNFAPSNNYSTLGANPSSCSISQIISEDPALANKFSKWFMGTSDRFLRVGTSWLGRTFVNILAGNIPLFTSKTVSTQISNNVNLWLGRSDLVRTGMSSFHATVLQDVGIKNVNDLAGIMNPADQAVVAQMMISAAAGRGQPLMVDQMMVSSWVATAQQLPKYF